MSVLVRSFNEDTLDLNDKSILVTGGTGSFGKAVSKYILEKWSPSRLIIFSRDELKQFDMQNQEPYKNNSRVRFFIGDVRDSDRLDSALMGVDYVIHAAAMKQITTAEYNPFECIKTNVIGAENVVKSAIKCKVRKVIALSTDKAANPICLYGASKLASDKIFVAANHMVGGDNPIFSIIRYGNVLNSRGSVVPFFKSCVEKGMDYLPITDNRMTRFWITLEQSVNFVLSSFANMRGGEIFVPKIGSMKVKELARAMYPNIELREVGIREGEKLHETMICLDDARNTVDLGDRYAILPSFNVWGKDNLANYYGKFNKVPDSFVYSSDKNTEWFDNKVILDLIKG